MTLKSQYERLLQQAQSYDSNISGTYNILKKNKKKFQEKTTCHIQRFINKKKAGEKQNDDDEEEEQDDENDDMRIISSQRAREAIIETLQRKNEEMQVMLDKALAQSEQIGRANDEKTQQLESHIEYLRQSLDLAAQKIQELEAGRRRRFQRPSTSEMTTSSFTTQQSQRTLVTDEENTHLIHELTMKMARLEADHTTISVARKAVQDRLANALRDLGHLRQQFEEFQFTKEGFDQLQEAYQQQFKRIEELNKSLEEHRAILARLRDRGMPIPSLSDYDSSVSTTSGSSSSSRTLHSKNEQEMSGGKNLLDELQLAFGKHLPNQTRELEEEEEEEEEDGASVGFSSEDHSPSESHESSRNRDRMEDREVSQAFPALSSWAHMAERNLTSFYNAPSEYALQTALPNVGLDDPAIMDEARRLLAYIDGEDTPEGMPFDDDDLYQPGRMDYASLDLYPHPTQAYAHADCDPSSFAHDEPKGFIGHIKYLIQNLFRAVWRWCRFAIVLTAAILINLWRGPEAFLEK
ncbi:hypothetical protein EC973_003555 [Apophysomyces ossiformis]|uniref:Uncharacterized protein n=1 Tax=Apophysomyces ossiformis TaxID=679940 RepID=A0A8H7BME8_9FUNG|nr:hypothetical protein EC973_003555 [Apophysomyces ossiformis]